MARKAPERDPPISPLQVVEQIAELLQLPQDWRRQEFVGAVRDLILEFSMRASIRATHNADLKKARNKLLEARDALRRLNGLVDMASIDSLVAELSILLGANPEPAAARKRGRRKGSADDWLFQRFVLELLSIVRSSGVELSLSKLDRKPRGTLIAALDLLRPHVGCIPRVPPYKTLERLRASRSRPGPSSLDLLRRKWPPPPFRL